MQARSPVGGRGKRYQNAANNEYQGRRYPLTEGLVQKVSHGGPSKQVLLSRRRTIAGEPRAA
jgi:hypothetical protein